MDGLCRLRAFIVGEYGVVSQRFARRPLWTSALRRKISGKVICRFSRAQRVLRLSTALWLTPVASARIVFLAEENPLAKKVEHLSESLTSATGFWLVVPMLACLVASVVTWITRT